MNLDKVDLQGSTQDFFNGVLTFFFVFRWGLKPIDFTKPSGSWAPPPVYASVDHVLCPVFINSVHLGPLLLGPSKYFEMKTILGFEMKIFTPWAGSFIHLKFTFYIYTEM